MKTKNIFCVIVFCTHFLIGGWQLLAQEYIAPVSYNPFIKATRTINSSTFKTTALSLPFFEDFSQYDAIPDISKWADRQTYINNTMAVNMMSRGVATFDAINQYGKPYDTTNPNIVRYADSLTSNAIDLSGKKPADSIYLSFFYQPAGNGFSPEKNDSLLLYFRSKAGSSGTWIKVWSKSDTMLQPFKQIMIPLVDTNFLYSSFQFRFVNKASIGINDDVWNLDYIRLNDGRNKFDTAINDVAYTHYPSNLLNDYTSMPYRQFLANTSAERANKFKSTIKNNFNSNQNIPSFGFVSQMQATSASLGSDAGSNRLVGAKNTSDIEFNTYSSSPSAGHYDKVVFENKFHLEAPSADVNRNNDTIISNQVFDNYLAYDDGTAEMSYFLNLFPTLPGKIAVEHHLNQADTLRGLAIYFGRQVPLASYKYFSIVVYKTIAYGSSSKDDIIYELENLQPNYIDTVNHFWIYKFEKPVPMPIGTFYIGTTQPALSGSDSLYIGLDRNRIGGNHAYYNVLNVWTPSTISGALMLRPILGQPISGSNVKINLKQDIVNIWPNPTHNELNYLIPSNHKNCNFEIKNMMGQVVQKGGFEYLNGSLKLGDYLNGQYLIQFYTDNRLINVQKFLKQ